MTEQRPGERPRRWTPSRPTCGSTSTPLPTPPSHRPSAERKEQKTFFPIRVFGKLVDTCATVKNGVKVLVEGKLEISQYTDKEGQ